MIEASDHFEATEERFERVIDKFKKNNKRGYTFLVREGERFQHAIFLLVKKMIEEIMFM